jgi:hypothetical protein
VLVDCQAKLVKLLRSACRSEIAKEWTGRARGVQEEKRAEEREVLIKVVKALWSEDKRSVADGYKRPIEYYLRS